MYNKLLARTLVLTVFVHALLSGCVKEYAVPGHKYNDIVVIDGMLTEKGGATVKISHSYDDKKQYTKRGAGAEVSIICSDGQVTALPEARFDEGTYSCAAEALQSLVGNTYQLKVIYENNTYLSSPEKMLPVADLQDVSFEYADDSSGVWILASAEGKNDETRYFSWAYNETWKIRTPYTTERFIDNQICYTSKNSKGIITTTTETLHTNKQIKTRIFFIDFKNERLAMRYSVLLKLQSLSRETHLYMSELQKTNVNNGGLFDPIPLSLAGNIVAESGDIPVIGNFQVSAESEKRLYIDYNDLAAGQKVYWASDYCQLEKTLDTNRVKDLLNLGWAIMDTVRGQDPGIRLLNYASCFDCTATGGKVTAPSWWVESSVLRREE